MVTFTQNSRYSKCLLVVAALGLITCAAPEEPAGLQQSSPPASTTKKEGTAPTAAGQATYNFGGAPVGDDTMKAEVKACVEKGTFYERRTDKTVGCTTMKLAKVNCTADGVRAAMSIPVRDTWDSKFLTDGEGGLKGYLVDQCLDCPTWDANSVCAELAIPRAGNESKRAGFIINLVKQEGTGISLRRAFNPK